MSGDVAFTLFIMMKKRACFVNKDVSIVIFHLLCHPPNKHWPPVNSLQIQLKYKIVYAKTIPFGREIQFNEKNTIRT